ncbi:helix-turn-helix transcriptional regulator [Nocardiopsis sp. ARC36]
MAAERRVRTNAGGTGTDGVASEPWTRFGARVRAARESAGISLQQIGSDMVTDHRKISRIEEGDQIPDLRTAMGLDRALNAEGVLWDAWAQTHITARLKEGATVADLLEQVFQLRAYAPLVIPEPFLIGDYSGALDRIERPLEDHRRLKDRPRIGSHHTAGSGPPYFGLVVDEAALTRVVADAGVTRRQLEHLHELTTRERVNLHVIREEVTHHPGLRGAFWTLSFSPRHALAYTPHPRGPGHLVTDAVQVKGYADLFATLQGVALPAHESVRLLEEAAERLSPPASAPSPGAAGPSQPSPGKPFPEAELRALTTGHVPAHVFGH